MTDAYWPPQRRERSKRISIAGKHVPTAGVHHVIPSAGLDREGVLACFPFRFECKDVLLAEIGDNIVGGLGRLERRTAGVNLAACPSRQMRERSVHDGGEPRLVDDIVAGPVVR